MAALAEHPCFGQRVRRETAAVIRREKERSPQRDLGPIRSGFWCMGEAGRKHEARQAAPHSLVGSGSASPGGHARTVGRPGAVFPGRRGADQQRSLKTFWAAIPCRKADIQGVRLHDLRHTHASILASAGLSLPVIGALLGDTQAATKTNAMRISWMTHCASPLSASARL